MSNSRSSDQCDLQVKLLIIGTHAPGKTSLLTRYVNNSFSDKVLATIGIDFKIKKSDIDSTKIKLQIWDTSGQERLRPVTATYLRGMKGIMLAYDVTNRQSFESVLDWIPLIRRYADKCVNVVLVGTKCDLVDERVVSTEEGQKLALDLGVPFYECSAKDNVNVDEAFESLAKSLKNRFLEENELRIEPCIPNSNSGAPQKIQLLDLLDIDRFDLLDAVRQTVERLARKFVEV